MKITILLTLLSLLAALSCASSAVSYIQPGTDSSASLRTPADPPPMMPPVMPPVRQSSAGTNSSLALLLGGRVLDNASWAPVDDQLLGGLEFSSMPKYFPLGIEFGYQGSYNSSQALNGSTMETLRGEQHEIYIGPRIGIQDPAWAMWAGLGFSMIYSKGEGFVSGSKAGDNDTVFGGYAHAGVEYKFNKSFGIGLDARGMLGQDAQILGQNRDTSYVQMALVLALHF